MTSLRCNIPKLGCEHPNRLSWLMAGLVLFSVPHTVLGESPTVSESTVRATAVEEPEEQPPALRELTQSPPTDQTARKSLPEDFPGRESVVDEHQCLELVHGESRDQEFQTPETDTGIRLPLERVADLMPVPDATASPSAVRVITPPEAGRGLSVGATRGSGTTLLSLATVLVLLGATAMTLRRWRPSAQFRESGAIQILERHDLDGRHQIYLLRSGNRLLTVGASPQGLSTLFSEEVSPELLERLRTETATDSPGRAPIVKWPSGFSISQQWHGGRVQ